MGQRTACSQRLAGRRLDDEFTRTRNKPRVSDIVGGVEHQVGCGAVEGVDDRGAVRGQRVHFEPTIIHKGRARIRDLAGREGRVEDEVTDAVLDEITRAEDRRGQRTFYRARARHIDVIHRDSEVAAGVYGDGGSVVEVVDGSDKGNVERATVDLNLASEAGAETAQEKRFGARLHEGARADQLAVEGQGVGEGNIRGRSHVAAEIRPHGHRREVAPSQGRHRGRTRVKRVEFAGGEAERRHIDGADRTHVNRHSGEGRRERVIQRDERADGRRTRSRRGQSVGEANQGADGDGASGLSGERSRDRNGSRGDRRDDSARGDTCAG